MNMSIKINALPSYNVCINLLNAEIRFNYNLKSELFQTDQVILRSDALVEEGKMVEFPVRIKIWDEEYLMHAWSLITIYKSNGPIYGINIGLNYIDGDKNNFSQINRLELENEQVSTDKIISINRDSNNGETKSILLEFRRAYYLNKEKTFTKNDLPTTIVEN